MVNLERAQRDKKLKLANPNFHVSRTRLSLKNLPKDVDEKKLRVCCDLFELKTLFVNFAAAEYFLRRS